MVKVLPDGSVEFDTLEIGEDWTQKELYGLNTQFEATNRMEKLEQGSPEWVEAFHKNENGHRHMTEAREHMQGSANAHTDSFEIDS